MRRITRNLSTYLLMLLIAAFVVVPAADALACALEPHPTVVHTGAVAHDADGQGKASSDHALNDACGHNHCHHSTVSLPAIHVTALVTPLLASWMNVGDAATYAVAHDELARPPRA